MGRVISDLWIPSRSLPGSLTRMRRRRRRRALAAFLLAAVLSAALFALAVALDDFIIG